MHVSRLDIEVFYEYNLQFSYVILLLICTVCNKIFMGISNGKSHGVQQEYRGYFLW